MRENKEKIIMYQHPDALYAVPYKKNTLSPERYIKFKDKFKIKNKDNLGATLTNSGEGCLRIDACLPGVIRIRVSPESSFKSPSTTASLGLIKNRWKGAPFSYSDNSNEFSFQTEAFKFILDHSTMNISVADKNGNRLIETTKGGFRFSPEKPDYSGHRLLTSFKLKNEKIFGFGGRIIHPNRTGTTVDIFSMKVGKISGDYGGCPVPFFISTKGYGFFFNNPWPHVYFDMGKTYKDEWFLHAPGGECDIFVLYGPEFKDIVKLYTDITGRIPIPSKWWLGFWCSSLIFETANQALKVAKRLRKEKWPCDAVVLDGPWRAGPNFVKEYQKNKKYPSNDMDWHPSFGDGPSMVKKLKSMNFKTILHLNSRNFKASTYEPALKKGLLRRQGEEVVPQFTCKKAESFYRKFLIPRIKEGVSLWWTDHADRVSGEIKKGIPSRNLFGALWNRLLAQIMKIEGHPNHIALTRGSGIGGQKYGLPWPGDTRCGIDCFEEDIWFCLNAGLAGFPITSVDSGGFTVTGNINGDDEPRPEKAFEKNNICRRLCQSIFFVPAPRIHNSGDSLPKLPWNCPASTRRLYKKILEERYRLTPYIFSYALNSAKNGEPILRPLVYHYRTDKKTYNIGDEFFMGEWLLIAPITKKDVRSRKVYLPRGKWIHLYSDKEFNGPCNIEINAPLYDITGLPVFVKAGAIVVRQPVAYFLQDDIPDNLILDIYPHSLSEFQLNESKTITNRFICKETKKAVVLGLENNTYKDRVYAINVHNISSVNQISVNGKPLQKKKIRLNNKKKLLLLKIIINRQSSIDVEITK